MININVYEYLDHLKYLLLNQSRIPIELSLKWVKKFPESKCVYIIFENKNIIYVGETKNIKKRMNNLRSTTHHTLRRTLGEKLFSRNKTYTKASSTKKYSPEIEDLLEDWIRKNLSVAFIEVKLGRKELEELFLTEFTNLYNK